MRKSTNESDGSVADEGTTGDRSESDARATLLELMAGSEDEFRRRTADRLAELPTYGVAPAGRLAGIVDEIAWVYRTFLDCVAEERDLSPAELDQLEDIGCSRARQSISFEEMHGAFQEVFGDSLTMLADHAQGLAAHDPEALEVLPEFDRTLSRFALQATDAMRRGHGRPDAHAAPSPVDGWIQQALSAPPSAMAGEDGSGPSDLVIALPADPDAGVTALVHELTETIGAAVARPIVSAPVRHALALVAHGLDREDAARRYDQVARRHQAVVIHGRALDPDCIAASYSAMRPHLAAVTGALPKSGAVPLGEVMLFTLLSTVSNEAAERFTSLLLGPLLATSHDDPLLETLEAYVDANGTVTDTARTLNLTDRTVRRRLDELSEVLGFSVRHKRTLLHLHTALTLLRIHRDTWPPVGDPRWEVTSALW